jgi:anti-sigma B factor antagonist
MTEYQRLRIDQLDDITFVRFRDSRISNLVEIQELGEELYRLIEPKVRRKLVLDFAGVEFFSSAAIGKLISLSGKLRAHGGGMKLCNVRPEILGVFHVCQLDRVFDIRQDEADATTSFGLLPR